MNEGRLRSGITLWPTYIAGVILAFLSAWVAMRGYPRVNEQVFLAINSLGAHGDWIWQNLTTLGEGLVAIVLLSCFSRQDGRFIWILLVAALLAGAGSQLLKYLFEMPRPAAVLAPDTFNLIGVELRSRAFPSGHATAALAAAVIFSWRFPNLKWVSFGFFLLVACSRIVVGAHWPFDVLAGACLGYLSGQAAVLLAAQWRDPIPAWLAIIAWLLLLALALWLVVFPLDYPAAKFLSLAIAAAAIVISLINLRKLLAQ